MRSISSVIALLLLGGVSCTTSPVPLHAATFFHANGQLAAAGRWTTFENNGFVIARVEGRQAAPWRQYYRVGTWRYWYPSGVLRAVVEYGLGEYTECCVAGRCRNAYETTDGHPHLFSEDGSAVKLTRAASSACIQTNCGGCTPVARPRYILPADLAPEWNPHEPDAP
jgi:hypothetical protein